MSLSDCPQCWDTPCTCGYMYARVLERMYSVPTSGRTPSQPNFQNIPIHTQEGQAIIKSFGGGLNNAGKSTKKDSI